MKRVIAEIDRPGTVRPGCGKHRAQLEIIRDSCGEVGGQTGPGRVGSEEKFPVVDGFRVIVVSFLRFEVHTVEFAEIIATDSNRLGRVVRAVKIRHFVQQVVSPVFPETFKKGASRAEKFHASVPFSGFVPAESIQGNVPQGIQNPLHRRDKAFVRQIRIVECSGSHGKNEFSAPTVGKDTLNPEAAGVFPFVLIFGIGNPDKRPVFFDLEYRFNPVEKSLFLHGGAS